MRFYIEYLHFFNKSILYTDKTKIITTQRGVKFQSQ